MSKLKATDSINKYTYGGVGAHWKGCNEVHWDCQIRALQKQVDELTEKNKSFAQTNYDLIIENNDIQCNLTSLRQSLEEAVEEMSLERCNANRYSPAAVFDKIFDILKKHGLVED